MDKYKKIQLICWIIVFVVFAGLAVWAIVRSGFATSKGGFRLRSIYGPYEEKGRYSVDGSDISSISIDWVAGDIAVIPYDMDVVEFVEYAQRDLEDDEVLSYTTGRETLTIKFTENQSRFFDSMPPKKLEIFVPAELAGRLKDFIINTVSSTVDTEGISSELFQIDSVSGKVTFNNIKSNTIKISTTSGSIGLSDAEAGKASFSSVSGSIRTEKLGAEELSAKTTSGSVKMENTGAEKLFFNTVSGDITYNGTFTKLEAESTSGRFTLTNTQVPEGFNINTVSGSVDITMPAFDGFAVKVDTTSGDFRSDIPASIGSKGSGRYYISTTSGDIDIHELR